MKRVWLFLCLLSIACGSKSPTTPSTTPPATVTPTRIIALSGNMAFGNIQINSSFSATLNVRNDGNSPLTISGLSGSTSFISTISTQGANFTIPPGTSHDIVVTFKPTAPQLYSGTLTVNADQTSGTNTIEFSGTGSLAGIPLFSKSGRGNTVFDVPTYVNRLHVTGTYTGNSSNFVARLAGRLIVNELVGTAWNSTKYDGIVLAAGGGVLEISASTLIDWTFTEVR